MESEIYKLANRPFYDLLATQSDVSRPIRDLPPSLKLEIEEMREVKGCLSLGGPRTAPKHVERLLKYFDGDMFGVEWSNNGRRLSDYVRFKSTADFFIFGERVVRAVVHQVQALGQGPLALVLSSSDTNPSTHFTFARILSEKDLRDFELVNGFQDPLVYFAYDPKGQYETALKKLGFAPLKRVPGEA